MVLREQRLQIGVTRRVRAVCGTIAERFPKKRVQRA